MSSRTTVKMVGIKAAALALLTVLALAEKPSDDIFGDKVGSECMEYDDKEKTNCRTWRIFNGQHLRIEDIGREHMDCNQCQSLGKKCSMHMKYNSLKGGWEVDSMECTPAAPKEDVKKPSWSWGTMLPIYHGEL